VAVIRTHDVAIEHRAESRRLILSCTAVDNEAAAVLLFTFFHQPFGLQAQDEVVLRHFSPEYLSSGFRAAGRPAA
jgi:hypothetical protein